MVAGGDPFSRLCEFGHLFSGIVVGLLLLSVRERKYSAGQGGDFTVCVNSNPWAAQRDSLTYCE